MSKNKLDRVLELLKAEKANEAQKIFNEIEVVETVDYFMVKGKLEQKFQNWGKAINAYTKVI
ncbi:MAG: hypothetical protein Q7U86_03175, partial [Draconibacterium sp.]|nr:hypothetical protein [Draconibacterium sp.]